MTTRRRRRRWSATWLRVTASRSSGASALGKDPHGSISEITLIVKAKQDGTVK